MVQLTHALSAALLATSAIAHGDLNREIMRRKAHLEDPYRRNILNCKRDLVDGGWVRNQQQRREEKLHELRVAGGFAKRGDLVRRQDPSELEMVFGTHKGCTTLDAEQTEGPYWVTGELVRQNIIGTEPGVKLHLDINVIDVTTCKPVEDTYVELWGANATGVYTGVQAKVNGDGSGSSLKSDNLRGIQPTDANGTASFITIVPGHYRGRTNHLHTVIHQGAKLLPNNTIEGGVIPHVGQFFINQDQLDVIESSPPYNQNPSPFIWNEQDALYVWGFHGGDIPLIQLTLIGKTLEDGLFGTIDVGINSTYRIDPSPINRWTKDGGVPVEGSLWEGFPDPATCINCRPRNSTNATEAHNTTSSASHSSTPSPTPSKAHGLLNDLLN